MRIFSFHLAHASAATTLRAFRRPPTGTTVPGLHQMECLAAMTLGAPILSPARMQLHRLAVFASWEHEGALEDYLAEHPLGGCLAAGWHVRLAFLRRWGNIPEFTDLPDNADDVDPARPVVAVTLARLKLPEVFRFIHWGKPVECQVRDHPHTTLALAAMRPLRTFSTFSVWHSQQAMTDMVHGRGGESSGRKHAEAMRERKRRDFHHHFATYRFRPLSEHGCWAGRRDWVPE